MDKAEKEFGKESWQYKLVYNTYIAGVAGTLTHELFVHVELHVNDYSDDGKLNRSTQNGVWDHDYMNKSFQKDVKMNSDYKPIIINVNLSNLYLYEGWYVMKAIHKWLDTGKSNYEIYEQWFPNKD